MGYDSGLANRLRAAGLEVVEVAGWQTRGSSSFTPRGSVNHHTAGGPNGATPSLNTCIYGRPDLAGPLCNVMQSREPSWPDKAYVIAAGRANHAGSGSWHGLEGNSTVYGLEIEHVGTSSISEERRQIAARIHAAMIQGCANPDPELVCQHFEWTTRKIDLATEVDGDGFRQRIAQALEQGGDDLPYTEQELRNIVGDAVNSVFTTAGSGARKGTADCAEAGVDSAHSTGGSDTRVAIDEIVGKKLKPLQDQLDAIADAVGVSRR